MYKNHPTTTQSCLWTGLMQVSVRAAGCGLVQAETVTLNFIIIIYFLI